MQQLKPLLHLDALSFVSSARPLSRSKPLPCSHQGHKQPPQAGDPAARTQHHPKRTELRGSERGNRRDSARLLQLEIACYFPCRNSEPSQGVTVTAASISPAPLSCSYECSARQPSTPEEHSNNNNNNSNNNTKCIARPLRAVVPPRPWRAVLGRESSVWGL